MSTIASPQLRELAAEWKTGCGFKSAVISGIVGDTSHAQRGGYHISRQDQVSKTNYSVLRPDDKPGNGPDNTASAIDMTMNTADMILCTKRLVKAYENLQDPRRKYLNGFNGTVDGTYAKRWDIYARVISPATRDHLWHVHISIRRKYSTSATAAKAIVSILRGESVAKYLESIGVVPVPPKSEPSKAVRPAPVPPKVAPVKAPPYPGRVLRRNDRATKPDTAVKAFQVQMVKRGWKSLGTPDGFFGPKMESVVKRWQTTCRMTSDGVIGPKTWPTPWTRPFGS